MRTNTQFLTVNICQGCDADVSVYKMSYNNCRTHWNEHTSYADVSTQGEDLSLIIMYFLYPYIGDGW